jgi:aspartyl-tRNA(Asn)/glutamyl-tRNA(Gln) amidotransferase subunit B
MNNYIPIIGLEVHVELKTKSKMFCQCSAGYFGEQPNTHCCPVCLGLPGALPVPNKKAIEWCVKIALALNCQINEFSKFDRKNYFYPDLPKGYQISQYDLPFGENGFVSLGSKTTPESKNSEQTKNSALTGNKKIRIRRVHMEEDTGKLSHQEIDDEKVSLIDFNRSGIPLVEIVTEPDFHDATEVKEYLQKLQLIVRYLDVANADMDKGEMRLEPNISLSCHLGGSEGLRSWKESQKDSSPLAQNDFELPNYKVEVKNINSFKFVEKAINYEIKRQQEILEKNQTPVQETRGWDEHRQKTFSQRLKEDAQDYRYFPEPDIPPIRWSETQIKKLKEQLPELQDEKIARFEKDYALSYYDAEILTREKGLADYFEKAIHHHEQVRHDVMKITSKQIANWIINKKIDYETTSIETLIQTIMASQQTTQIDEKELENVISAVLKENVKAVEDYKNGKETVIMYLLGQTMRKLGRKVDTQMIKKKLEEQLKDN